MNSSNSENFSRDNAAGQPQGEVFSLPEWTRLYYYVFGQVLPGVIASAPPKMDAAGNIHAPSYAVVARIARGFADAAMAQIEAATAERIVMGVWKAGASAGKPASGQPQQGA
jgi:hypothetical protein